MTGMLTASLTAAVSSQSKPARVPSAVHRGEKNLAGAAGLGFARPLDDAAAGGLAAALHENLRIAHWIGGLRIAARIDGDDDGLRAKAAADGVDQRGSASAAELMLTLSAPASKTCCRIVGGANAAAHGEGHKELARRAANRIEQRRAAFVGRGNVEQDDFVGALVVRGARQARPDRRRR